MDHLPFDSDGYIDMERVPDVPVDIDLVALGDVPPLGEAAWLRVLATTRDLVAEVEPIGDDLDPGTTDDLHASLWDWEAAGLEVSDPSVDGGETVGRDAGDPCEPTDAATTEPDDTLFDPEG